MFSQTISLLDATLRWYLDQDIAYFKNVTSSNFDIKKGLLYTGVYKGRFIFFEVFATHKSYFDLSLLVLEKKKLIGKLNKFSGTGFLLIVFSNMKNIIFALDSKTLESLITKYKRKISIEEFSSIAQEVNISFPGIIDFIPVVDKWI